MYTALWKTIALISVIVLMVMGVIGVGIILYKWIGITGLAIGVPSTILFMVTFYEFYRKT